MTPLTPDQIWSLLAAVVGLRLLYEFGRLDGVRSQQAASSTPASEDPEEG